MYRIYSASRTDVISTEVYQGMTVESVPADMWETVFETENLDEALERLSELKSEYVPGKLTEYFLADGDEVIKYASGLFTKNGKRRFIVIAVVIIAVFTVVAAVFAKRPEIQQFINTHWLYGMLIILAGMLIYSTVKDKNKKRVKKK